MGRRVGERATVDGWQHSKAGVQRWWDRRWKGGGSGLSRDRNRLEVGWGGGGVGTPLRTNRPSQTQAPRRPITRSCHLIHPCPPPTHMDARLIAYNKKSRQQQPSSTRVKHGKRTPTGRSEWPSLPRACPLLHSRATGDVIKLLRLTTTPPSTTTPASCTGSTLGMRVRGVTATGPDSVVALPVRGGSVTASPGRSAAGGAASSSNRARRLEALRSRDDGCGTQRI